MDLFKSLRGGTPSGNRDIPCLVVALDFGTTFSGIAYINSADTDTINIINNWPGAEDRDVPKAPTVIQYEIDSKTEFKWGYEVDPFSKNKITLLKLLLDPDQERPYFIPKEVEAEMAKLPKSPVQVVSDYMGAIFKHAMAEIEGAFLVRDLLDDYEKRVVLTVPAVWSDKAKSMTLEAAQRAGIANVEMITEPEAAAIMTLLTAKNKGLKKSDAVLICDAGGGTVDLVAYDIDSVNPLKLRALTAPSGGICGSVMVNKLFEKEVQRIVKNGPYLKLKESSAYQIALTQFDSHLKPGFRGLNDPDRIVNFPMAGLRSNRTAGLVSNSMTLSGETMARIFDPVVHEVEKLVLDQVVRVNFEKTKAGKTERIKAIFLVGGFGASAYLRTAIEKSHPSVLVIQPKEAWTAIMKGAAISAMCSAPVITSTRAPKHYGTDGLDKWDDMRDAGQERHWDEWDEIWRCNTMTWSIHKDDELVRGEKKTKMAFVSTWSGRTFKVLKNAALLNVTALLRESSLTPAPVHPFETTINCELKTNLSGVPLEFFTRKFRASDNAPYWRLAYNLQIESHQSGLLKFSLEVGGKEYGAVEAMY